MTLLEQIIVVGLMALAFASMAGACFKVKSDVEQKIEYIQEQTEEHERLLKGVLDYVEYDVDRDL